MSFDTPFLCFSPSESHKPRLYSQPSPLSLAYTKSELVQAVGRARLVRNDCKVIVFSNYPVPGAKMLAAGKAVRPMVNAGISAAVSSVVNSSQPRLVEVEDGPYQDNNVMPEAQPLKAA